MSKNVFIADFYISSSNSLQIAVNWSCTYTKLHSLTKKPTFCEMFIWIYKSVLEKFSKVSTSSVFTCLWQIKKTTQKTTTKMKTAIFKWSHIRHTVLVSCSFTPFFAWHLWPLWGEGSWSCHASRTLVWWHPYLDSSLRQTRRKFGDRTYFWLHIYMYISILFVNK